MRTFVIATRNLHKVGEVRNILGAGCRCLALSEFPNAPEIVEGADSFAGNAIRKAVGVALWLVAASPRGSPEEPVWVLADDSGLEVDFLGGAPGVRSARFAAGAGRAGNARDEDNNAKLLNLLQHVPWEKRTARFRCVLALAQVPCDGVTHARKVQAETFEGACEGRIGFEPKGAGGFGYDPLFCPNGYQLTFAELGEETKNTLSHRARALAKLKQHFSK